MNTLENKQKFELKKIVYRLLPDHKPENQFSRAFIYRAWKTFNVKEIARIIKNHFPEISIEVNSVLRMK